MTEKTSATVAVTDDSFSDDGQGPKVLKTTTVGVDLVAHPDAAETVADIRVRTDDSMPVVFGLGSCAHRP